MNVKKIEITPEQMIEELMLKRERYTVTSYSTSQKLFTLLRPISGIQINRTAFTLNYNIRCVQQC